MKAVIMAGGDGRRLRPLTCTKPKPLIPLLNRPILDYTMDLLAKHNINEAVFTLHYLGDMIKNISEAAEHGEFPQAIRSRAENSAPQGASVRLWEGFLMGIPPTENLPAVKLLKRGGESVLVLSGDGITDIDLSAVIRAHEQSDAAATIVLKRVEEPTEYGVALLDENGTIKVSWRSRSGAKCSAIMRTQEYIS